MLKHDVPTAKRPRLQSRQAAAPSQAPSIAHEIGRRLTAASKANPGRVHTPFDFLDLGSPHSGGMTLMRLVRNGALRRLARGLYDVPRQLLLFGELQPSADEIVPALSRRDGASVQPAQAMDANLLSLSEQVPVRAKPVATLRIAPPARHADFRLRSSSSTMRGRLVPRDPHTVGVWLGV